MERHWRLQDWPETCWEVCVGGEEREWEEWGGVWGVRGRMCCVGGEEREWEGWGDVWG